MQNALLRLSVGGQQRDLDTSGWAHRDEVVAAGEDAEERNSGMAGKGASQGSGGSNGSGGGGETTPAMGHDDGDDAESGGGASAFASGNYAQSHSLPTPEEHGIAYHRSGGVWNRTTEEISARCGSLMEDFGSLFEDDGFLRSKPCKAAIATVLIALVLILTILGATGALGGGSDTNASLLGASGGAGSSDDVTVKGGGPTGATSEEDRVSDVMSVLETASGMSISDLSSPQGRAAKWIAFDDAFRLGPDSPYLVQRYSLAVLYYALSASAPQDPLINTPEGETNLEVQEPWLDGESGECAWTGIVCDGDARVTEIHLGYVGLKGTLPPEIGALKGLMMVDLTGNVLEGGVPEEIGSLEHLEALYLNDNAISGPVPQTVCDLRFPTGHLTVFTVDCGEVSCSCCTSCLDDAGLPSDALGPPPGDDLNEDLPNDESIASVTSVPPDETQNDTPNQAAFTTTRGQAIRSKIVTLSPQADRAGTAQAKALDWIVRGDEMELDASDPDLIQRYVVAVMYYSMGGDSWPFPGWLNGKRDECRFPGVVCNGQGRIHMISLVSSGLTGNIPSEMSRLVDLKTLEFNDNDISGTVPMELGELPHIEDLQLADNDLQGTIPEAICRLHTVGALMVLTADCDTTPKQVTCDCCTNCGYVHGQEGQHLPNEPQVVQNKPQSEPLPEDGPEIQLPPEQPLSQPEPKPKPAPVPAPLPNQSGLPLRPPDESDEVVDRLYELSESAVVKSSGPGKAAMWILDDDAQRLSADSPRLAQRFVLATMWHELDGPNWTVKNAKGGAWTDGSSNECQWTGVGCDSDGRVTSIVLENGNLNGIVPDMINMMGHLQRLDLSGNNLRGGLPPEIGELKSLAELDVNSNNMIFEMPVQICNLATAGTLTKLWADCGGQKPKVQCSCCTQCDVAEFETEEDKKKDAQVAAQAAADAAAMEAAAQAETAAAADAAAPAGVPPVIDTSSREAGIKSVLSNAFDNIIAPSRAMAVDWIINTDPKRLNPTDANLVQRYVLVAMYHSLGGENWSYADWLDGSKSECEWTGVACEDGVVTGIALANGNLQGFLPLELTALRSLKALDVSKNNLNGEIPPMIGYMSDLEILIVYDNNLVGSIPVGICQRKNDGRVKVLWADCEEVLCPCCTKCSEYYVN